MDWRSYETNDVQPSNKARTQNGKRKRSCTASHIHCHFSWEITTLQGCFGNMCTCNNLFWGVSPGPGFPGVHVTLPYDAGWFCACMASTIALMVSGNTLVWCPSILCAFLMVIGMWLLGLCVLQWTLNLLGVQPEEVGYENDYVIILVYTHATPVNPLSWQSYGEWWCNHFRDQPPLVPDLSAVSRVLSGITL